LGAEVFDRLWLEINEKIFGQSGDSQNFKLFYAAALKQHKMPAEKQAFRFVPH
jgi:hypothetical protein